MAKTKAKPKSASPWKLAIVGHDRVSPDSLLANPFNHRRHPQEQRDAVAASIRELGFIRSVTVNKRTGHIVDGHERVWQALHDEQPLIDVEYVDLSPEQEKLALAVLDKTTEMAEVDAEALDALLREIETGESELQALLAEMADEVGLYASGPVAIDDPPESVEENVSDLEAIKAQRKQGNENTAEKNDTEKYLVVVYPDRASREAAVQRLGLPADERYVPASAVTIKAKAKIAPVELGRPAKAASTKHSGAGG